ncbi:hypothetical protein D3H55_09160 [Bacillus salacetis]|uniref:DUF3862 domain-containing protein n=1 Tax=Bacillus salacetis TaxID=2315464 RepID=A0A3A1R5P7_9BACI|nr:hypothetical protein [Bacillus salacetis]RIW34673.1 hypothetical protein D3H55_09160 [Bacillus salacetis]
MGRQRDFRSIRLIIAGVMASSLFLGGCRLETGTNNEVKISSDETGSQASAETTGGMVTMEIYNQLDKGMSYEEVKAIIGSEGKPMTEPGDLNAAYIWDGENNAFLSVQFKKDKLSTKTQVGLK